MPGGYGWQNPWPLEWGGGETFVERSYEALKRAVGDGGYAKNEDGIDGLWRAVRAEALASFTSLAETAVLQAFPDIATDHIPLYEEYFRLTPLSGATEEQRREAIVAAYTRRIESDHPRLLQSLQQLDPRFTIETVARDHSIVVELGKAFQPASGGPFFWGSRTATMFPNYASEFILPVVLDLSTTPSPGVAEQLTMHGAKRLLNEVLASWMGYSVSTGGGSTGGFILDLSPLDATGLTPS
jgi:hypothetical protein